MKRRIAFVLAAVAVAGFFGTVAIGGVRPAEPEDVEVIEIDAPATTPEPATTAARTTPASDRHSGRGTRRAERRARGNRGGRSERSSRSGRGRSGRSGPGGFERAPDIEDDDDGEFKRAPDIDDDDNGRRGRGRGRNRGRGGGDD